MIVLKNLAVVLCVSGCVAVAEDGGRKGDAGPEEDELAEALTEAGIPARIEAIIADVTGSMARVVDLSVTAITTEDDDFLPESTIAAAPTFRAFSFSVSLTPQCQPPYPALGFEWIAGERYDVCKGAVPDVIFVDIYGVLDGRWWLKDTTRVRCSRSTPWLDPGVKAMICDH